MTVLYCQQLICPNLIKEDTESSSLTFLIQFIYIVIFYFYCMITTNVAHVALDFPAILHLALSQRLMAYNTKTSAEQAK